jgi:hypothetical protein
MTHRLQKCSLGALAISLAFLTVPLFSMSVWVHKNDLPAPRALHGVGVVNGVLYAAGGHGNCFGTNCFTATVARYNEAADTWTDVATLSPRKNHGTVVVGGLIYLIGGDDNDNHINSIEAFDPGTNTSSIVTPMNHVGSMVAAVELGNKLYVMGGSFGRGLIAETYDLSLNTWQALPNLARLTYSAGAAVYEGKVWMIGGTNPDTGEVYAEVDAYDPETNTWSVMPPMPAPRSSSAAVVVGDTLYVIGGFTPGIGGLSTVLKYHPTTGWVAGPDLNVARTSPAGALLNGHIYAVGGVELTAGGVGTAVLSVVESLAVDETADVVPTANAGLDQTLHAGSTVSLDGGGSFDDNTPTHALIYAWSFASTPAGSTVVLSGANTSTPTFVPDRTGTYVVQLIVTDEGARSSAPDSVVVSSTNQAPTANAGTDRVVLVGQVAALSGSGFDPENDTMTFAWTLTSAPAGSSAEPINPNSATPMFVADVAGTYLAQLVVSDGFSSGAADVVEITAVSAGNFSQMAIQDAADLIAGLTPAGVTTTGNQNALTNGLSQAVQFIQSGNLAQARQKLQAAIERTDGCALRGAADSNGPGRDWITTCVAQMPVYQSLVQALAAITP